jgi:hypothetical protein
MTPENEAKRDFLMRYHWDLKAIEELESEITACRLGALPGAIRYTGMPRGSGNTSDLSDYAVRIDELLAKLKAKREETISDLHDIIHAIEAVDDARACVLLRYKYIQRKTWREVAALMDYDEVYVKRELHSEALQKFKLPTKSYDVLI